MHDQLTLTLLFKNEYEENMFIKCCAVAIIEMFYQPATLHPVSTLLYLDCFLRMSCLPMKYWKKQLEF